MFRHRDKGRVYSHNVLLAALLSTVAGVVNIVGLLSLNTLTTNVTGHFAYFSEEFFLHNYAVAVTSIVYVFFFLIGAFVANTAMELTSRDVTHFSYFLPIWIEIVSLSFVALSPFLFGDQFSVVVLSLALLFAMGLQNALVTRISGSVVRTTHLTGIFTDLGIEFSQLLLYKKPSERKRLKRSIWLKLIIVLGFFIGGMVGALLHRFYSLISLLVPVGVLLFTLYYDKVRLNYYHIKRKFRTLSIHQKNK